jgi:16S rRNA processing protein RimM
MRRGSPAGSGAPPAPPVGRPEGDAGRRVMAGEFGRPHGVNGEVRLKSYTADPMAIAAYAPLEAEDGRRFTLDSVRRLPGTPDMLVARVAGIDGRPGAATLTRLRLSVPRQRLPAPAEEDEFYQADLIGLRVEDTAGAVIGRVAAVHDFGAGDILEIAPRDGGKTALLPFNRAFVPVVDLIDGRVVVAADALFASVGGEPRTDTADPP